MAEFNYFKYIVKEDTTISDLVSGNLSVFREYQSKANDLLSIVKEGESKTNSDRIVGAGGESDGSVILQGTELIIPKGKVPLDLAVFSGSNLFISETNYKGYWNEGFRQISNNSDYIPSEEVRGEKENNLKIKNYNLSVWIYLRGLDTIKDITDFVYTCNSGGDMEDIGNFSLTLEAFSSFKDIQRQGNENIISYSYYDGEKINTPWFIKHIQQKDVVWIRYEKLAFEGNSRRDKLKSEDWDVPKETLASFSEEQPMVYDMIGLVDDVSESSSSLNNTPTIMVRGRDLMALLMDDASYFYPVMFAEGSDYLMFDTQDNSKWFKRNFITGNYENFFVTDFRSIRDSIGFVINQLSNLGIVPDDLFTGYVQDEVEDTGESRVRDRRSKILKIQGDSADRNEDGNTVTPYVDWGTVSGLWQIIDVLVDPGVEERRSVNNSLVKSEGTLSSHMDEICQKPFVEFFGDTYVDKYVFTARQPPFTQEGIISYLNEFDIIEIKNEDILTSDLVKETEYYSWYQIQPQVNFLGTDSNISLGYLPIIYLERFADDFGNSRYMISDSYISERALARKDKEPLFDPWRESVVEDLKYIIDTTTYLPFTRRGNITINGDRRIKKGTFIRLKPTEEIFYVQGVSQSFSTGRNTIDRTTTLQLVRGMKEKYIYETGMETYFDEDGEFQVVDNPSYFNIVNTEKIKKQLTKIVGESNGGSTTTIVGKSTRTTSNFTVNDDVYDFFFKGKHWED